MIKVRTRCHRRAWKGQERLPGGDAVWMGTEGRNSAGTSPWPACLCGKGRHGAKPGGEQRLRQGILPLFQDQQDPLEDLRRALILNCLHFLKDDAGRCGGCTMEGGAELCELCSYNILHP